MRTFLSSPRPRRQRPPSCRLRPASSAKIAPPASVAKAGKIVYCTDATYPPEEFFQGSKIIGSDVDFGTAGIAKLMGVKAEFKNTTFDSHHPCAARRRSATRSSAA